MERTGMLTGRNKEVITALLVSGRGGAGWGINPDIGGRW